MDLYKVHDKHKETEEKTSSDCMRKTVRAQNSQGLRRRCENRVLLTWLVRLPES